MKNFIIECVKLTEQGKAAGCFTVGKHYDAKVDSGLMLLVVDDNKHTQVCIYPSCAFGEWKIADDSEAGKAVAALVTSSKIVLED